MSKKKKEDAPPPGAPAWMATFGDLMNLLLCFFVLLFSMSSVDAKKFEMIAASFSSTFSIFSAGSSAIGDGVLISNGVSQLNELDEYINSMGKEQEGEDNFGEAENTETSMEEIISEIEAQKLEKSEELAEKIEETITEDNLNKEITIDFNSQYVSLTLNGALLFDSGSDQLKQEVIPILKKVAVILERYAESIIEVEGHTDNVPIHNAAFRNNNVLSSFRAMAVADFLAENSNIDQSMIKHSGRGEYVPITDNATAEGRALNRRVEIKIYHTLSSY